MTRYARYAWTVLVYNILVILWGAYVRATGSGAGCGRHWPLCNGEVVPRSPRVETLIEFTHRATSGLALLSVVLLVIWAWRRYHRGHPVRLGAGLSLFFMLTESLVGASLVLFGWVARDTSSARAIVVAVHQANTMFLLGALTLTAWWATIPHPQRPGTLPGWWLGGLAGFFLIVMSGAITALGDTLFPARSLAEGLQQDFSPAAHFLIRLRVWHPVLAVAVGLLLMVLSQIYPRREERRLQRLAWLVSLAVLLQWLIGLLNLVLLVPVSTQLLHLLAADLLWVALVLYTLVLDETRRARHPAPASQPQRAPAPGN